MKQHVAILKVCPIALYALMSEPGQGEGNQEMLFASQVDKLLA